MRHMPFLVALLFIAFLSGSVGAQPVSYPVKPVRLVVPFAAGSSPDVVARLVAARLSEQVGQTFFIENRTGAAGIVGAAAVAKSEPDGYTMMYTINSVITANPHLYSKLQYDPLRSFAAVSEVVKFGYVLIASNKAEAKDLRGLIQIAKSQPGKLNFSSAGSGAGNHILMEMLMQLAGDMRMVHVPTRDPVVSVMTGETDVAFVAYTNGVPTARAGKVRALAVSLDKRLAMLPDVPAVDEVIPGYLADGWHGLLAPAGTPRPILGRLSSEVSRALGNTELRARLTDIGLEPVGSSPQDFADRISADLAKWGRVIRTANIKLD